MEDHVMESPKHSVLYSDSFCTSLPSSQVPGFARKVTKYGVRSLALKDVSWDHALRALGK